MAKKIKKLRLKPSARDKRRYFLVKGTNAKVKSAILEYIGVLGFAKSAYMKVNENRTQNSELRTQNRKRGFIVGSCLVKSLNDVRAALALAGIKIERVSGTLKGLRPSH